MAKVIIEKEIEKRELDINEDEIEEYREAFKLFDKDGSGSISHQEFFRCLKNLGQNVTKEEAQALVKELDEDNSGEISFEEFTTYMRKIKIQEEVDEDEVIRAFQTFDVDKDDQISNQEFRHILCNLGEDKFSVEECDELFKEADIDKDGFLNYREFVTFWRAK
jgi:Ca2+-binding EF-hand superfamily protein